MPTAYRIFKILSPFDRTMSNQFHDTLDKELHQHLYTLDILYAHRHTNYL